MSSILVLSIGLIFVSALVSSYLRHRHLDRVLQDLIGFHVTVHIQPEQVWGKFKLYSNAIEFKFSQVYTNHRGTDLASFVIFKEQMGAIDLIFRYHDELTPENQQRRIAQIERARNPGWFRRFKRRLRNFMVAFKEAISESIGLIASRVQQQASMAMLKNADGKLKNMSDNFLDIAVNAAYDPVLEHYIFSRVVFENTDSNGNKTEYSGILEEYSASWVSVLDCYLNAHNRLSLVDANRLMIQRNMDFELALTHDSAGVHYTLKIMNTDTQDITLKRITGPESFERKIEKTLSRGQTLDINIQDLPMTCLPNVDINLLPISLRLIAPERSGIESPGADDQQAFVSYPLLPELQLDFQTRRRADVYLQRSRGILRHAVELEN
jgi:hypothetical protein